MTEIAPDIEIYVKNAKATELYAWLTRFFKVENHKVFEAERSLSDFAPTELKLNLPDGGKEYTLRITPSAAGKAYTSLWFKTRPEFWQADIDCASSYLESVDTEVRCASEGWTESEEEFSEKWWKLTRNEATLVSWN